MSMESYGRAAKQQVLDDLQKVIDYLTECRILLASQKGIGAELYSNKLDDLIRTYTNVRKKVSSIH